MNRIASKVSEFFSTTFRSLHYRDFRLFWMGQCVSLIGTWMQRTAQVWLVYSITKSPLLVGLLGVFQFMPMMLFSLVAGVIVDRFPKKTLLIITQCVFMLQAIVLTILTYTGLVQYWHILVLSALFGLTQTVDMPTRQSYFVELVGRENLTNAISLNSTIFNLARIVGPAVSGAVMAGAGMVFCFFVNAISFIPVIIGILFISKMGIGANSAGKHIIPEITNGIRYIKQSRTLIINVFVMGAVCTFAMNFDVIIPVFAKIVLGRGADGYTGLLSASGAGAFIGALYLAYSSKFGLRKHRLLIFGVFSAVMQLATVVTHSFLLCGTLIAAASFANMCFLNTGNSIFQLNSSDEYRGRVMSVYSFLNQGSTPLGNLYVGTVMEHAGGDSGFVSCAAATLLLLSVIFLLNRTEIRTWLAEDTGQG